MLTIENHDLSWLNHHFPGILPKFSERSRHGFEGINHEVGVAIQRPESKGWLGKTGKWMERGQTYGATRDLGTYQWSNLPGIYGATRN